MINEILDGALDDELETILEAIRNRQVVLRQKETLRKKGEFKVGDKVKFQGISPKYLNGIKATIVEMSGRKSGTVLVNVDEDFRAKRYSGSRNVSVPLTAIEKVES